MVKAMHGQGWVGGVLRGSVLSSKARLGAIDVLRGLAWHGGAVSGPVGSSGVWLCKLRHYYGFVLRGRVERGFLWQGKAFRGVVWSRDVLLGAAGFIGALYSKVRSYCGVVWSVEALHGIVKFCPVKHCMVLRAKALSRLSILRRGTVRSGFARLRAAGQALVRRHLGFVWSCDVGRCMASFALASLRLGDVLLCEVWWSPVLQGQVRLGLHGYGGD